MTIAPLTSPCKCRRGAGVKESGNWLPGHGGWLDRVDASLFSIPTVYVLLALLGQV